MKKIIAFISALAVTLACGLSAPTEPLVGNIAVTPMPLIKGGSAIFNFTISNPNDSPLENYRLILGYSLENESSIIQVTEQTINIEAKGTFEQSIPWTVDFEAQPNSKYVARLLVLTDSGSTALETSTPLEFTQISVNLNINQSQLKQGDQAFVTVQVNNPSGINLEGYMLSIGYGAENDPSMFLITQDIPLTLSAGGTFSQEIPWLVDYIPTSGNYEVRAVILQSSIQIATIEIPITLTTP